MKRAVVCGLATLLISVTMIILMVQLFPYTGLGRIIAIPMTIVVNSAIIALGIFLSRKMELPQFVIIWTLIIVITASNTITFHPQENSPSVYKQIGHSISAVKHNDEIKLFSLYKPIESHDAEKLSPDKQTPQEYIVALHKFRFEIPLDGSFVLDESVNKYGVDPAIRNIEEISDKLVGHYEILWWYLEIFK
ncbi:hypothetical protein [Paenibacillus lutrae]|uniref:Uncharacterized protein n=1 Tax=Paenibacillus lutrae TaxID=2078573 RepID=A0A7X3FHG1_9BACL|nr:hypothetical protein [Paenibacillus lutrae]MVO99553.1 hypothetical protein [Paenibacillus lutrae]